MSNRTIKKLTIVPKLVQLIVVDSFCGAGGFTEGVEQATDLHGNRLAVVAAGINHDALAIASHAENHPETTHFVEDIRDKRLLKRILSVIKKARKQYPNARLLFHASLECTNFSNAKGGRSRDADSRSLASFMPAYLSALQPDLFTVENVREFMGWGPLVPKVQKTADGCLCCPIQYVTAGEVAKQQVNQTSVGNQISHEFIDLFTDYVKRHDIVYGQNATSKPADAPQIIPVLVPESRTKGKYYLFWRQYIESQQDYRYDHRLHNTADFGANTSRTRYFAQFVKPGIPLVWPEPTHAKNPKSDMFEKPLKRWRPIRECLELDDKGRSIFRNPPLSEKTYERIFEGLVRHVGNGDRAFISKYFTGEGMHFGLDQPAATIKTVDNQALVTAEPFMARLFATASNNHGTYPTDQPATTITTADGHAVVTPEPFAMNYHSGSPALRCKSMDDPAQTLTTENRLALVSPEPFVMQSNGGLASAKSYPADQPARVITASDNQSAVFCMKYHGNGDNTFPDDQPCSTLTTTDRVGVVQAEPRQTEQFVSLYYSQGKQDDSVDAPATALTTIPKHRLVSALFIDQQYGKSKPASVDQPSPCLTVNPHYAVVGAFVADPQWGGHSHSIDNPGHTIIARQDKAPASLVFITQRNSGENRNQSVDQPAKTVTTTGGNMEVVQPEWLMSNQHKNPGSSLDQPCPTLLTGTHHYVMSTNFSNVGVDLESPSPTVTADRHWAYLMSAEQGAHAVILVYETDTFWQRRIKAFMAEYGIVDILMRMLKVRELKLIQGFPENYVLLGSQTHQKKFIGNSVPPPYPKAWMTAIGLGLRAMKGGVLV